MPEISAAAKPTVVLVAFYNKKALGVRYLQAALERAGYAVRTVFYKDFNSVPPPRRSWSSSARWWRRPTRCWWAFP